MSDYNTPLFFHPHPPKSSRSGKSQPKIGQLLFVTFMIVVLILAIPIFMATKPQTQQYQYPLPPVEQKPTEYRSILEEIFAPIIEPIASALGLSGKPAPGTESVGISAEIGYTDTSGRVVASTVNIGLSGVGMLGMEGIWVKHHLGDGKVMKLYDSVKGSEGYVWVRPSVNVRVFNGTPEEWKFSVKVKAIMDGEEIDSMEEFKSGKGAPPMKVTFSQLTVKGGKIYNHLVKAKNKETTKQLCFKVDYTGYVKFENDTEPVIKQLKDANLGCFDFNIRPTGDFDFEMKGNVTVMPLAEVMVGGESGMGGYLTETITKTVTMPASTYVSTYVSTYAVTKVVTETVGGGVVTKTVTDTVTKTVTNTETIYSTYTVKDTVTVWKTETVRTELTVTQEKTVTVTKTEYLYYSYGGGGSLGPSYYATTGVLILRPFSEFIFIGGGRR